MNTLPKPEKDAELPFDEGFDAAYAGLAETDNQYSSDDWKHQEWADGFNHVVTAHWPDPVPINIGNSAGKGKNSVRLPHIPSPCRDCPFRKDTLQGWLGEDRMVEILEADSFVCHKKTDKQCAGHMLINGEHNAFVRLATRLGIALNLTGAEQVFASKSACIEHHKN